MHCLQQIPQMFTHSTLVDRMAAMLNYFLSTLVGPKQRNLKVSANLQNCYYSLYKICSEWYLAQV